MHHLIGVFVLILFPISVSAGDIVIMRNGDTLKVDVKKSTSTTIEYVYPNETVINERSKNEIYKVVYSSGRIEECNSAFQVPIVNGVEDWEKVVVSYNTDDVKGLKKVADLDASSGWGGSMGAGIGYDHCIKKLQKQAAKKGAGIILITGQPNASATARGAATRVTATAYKVGM
ncbi:MAG: hypothetical protein IKP81_14190 [Paludibacteraceae bacterium]|nr:hypothetical protein [Paludibacteraceae bacterium]